MPVGSEQPDPGLGGNKKPIFGSQVDEEGPVGSAPLDLGLRSVEIEKVSVKAAESKVDEEVSVEASPPDPWL